MRENRDQNNSEYGQFLSSGSPYVIHVYFWANLLPMKFLTLAHYIIICQRYTIWGKTKKKKNINIYIYIHIFFSGEWGMVEHKIFFCNMSLFLSRWNTFCWHETLFYAKSTCFFCIRLFFSQQNTFHATPHFCFYIQRRI